MATSGLVTEASGSGVDVGPRRWTPPAPPSTQPAAAVVTGHPSMRVSGSEGGAAVTGSTLTGARVGPECSVPWRTV